MNIPTIKLHDGYEIPAIGLGTVFLRGETGVDAITSAIRNGYRLIDSAIRYDNEGALGEAVRQSGIPREQLFLTSKLRGQYFDYDEALNMIQESLYRANLDYWDLFLLHWPNPKQDKYVEAWRALIQAKKNGWIRSIGVSNFMPEHLDRLIEETGETPVINQIELHPYFSQVEQRQADKERGIITEAWSPLSRARTVIHDETITELANQKGKTVSQVILRWHIQLGVIPLPRSSSELHQQENLNVFNFELTEDEMETINALTKPDGRIDNQDPREYEEF
ncbi:MULTISPECIES: aldo/keto reductase [unclassified Exiguobacterium]|uniref:aldo/keto reductase n=1 Tax=unclassified Exiguobacterium TaxID=2644629 RepID=UPI00103E51B7|nr:MULTISPECIES: aldo/keto reductase [unclassified Exiguobacterium]TCI42812.1 aldo/keto reductase [Exiguobacterium sp. SH5S32]TCI50175.1 aldo/keto reductase [Exiguobacterium sp. SH1S4]TCI53003.1 aldo/keto reductase [Exiguobacterium sp. SH1S21]TCI67536.1 aldo/keto reductase [Exiguobacterium sp. SH1S1]TCI76941.1 aldo/keto reductase [Exiguobacterium sp. SH0S1]